MTEPTPHAPAGDFATQTGQLIGYMLGMIISVGVWIIFAMRIVIVIALVLGGLGLALAIIWRIAQMFLRVF